MEDYYKETNHVGLKVYSYLFIYNEGCNVFPELFSDSSPYCNVSRYHILREHSIPISTVRKCIRDNLSDLDPKIGVITIFMGSKWGILYGSGNYYLPII